MGDGQRQTDKKRETERAGKPQTDRKKIRQKLNFISPQLQDYSGETSVLM